MSRLEALRRVAGLLGIATRHVDALGVWHEPDEETLSRLIAAFGLPADPQQAAEALADETRAAPFGLAAGADRRRRRTRRRCCLCGCRPGSRRRVEWHCRLEDGGEQRRPQRRRAALRLPADLPLGYHRLEVAAGGVRAPRST